MRLIPAIDLRHGNVVRLQQGDDARRTVYDADPAVTLRRFAAAGVDLVHVVDLDAAFGEPPQRSLIEKLAGVGPGIELGGGLRDAEAVEWALDPELGGCARIVIGSMVARDFAAFRRIAEDFPGRVVPAVEVAGGELKIAGWRESAALPLEELCTNLRGVPSPAVLVTDVERDGTLQGPNLDLARRVAGLAGIPALLSGGVHALDDLRAAARVPEIAGAIVGKAIYDGVFSVEEALAACAEEAGS